MSNNRRICRLLAAYIQQIRWFAGTQIRNVSSLGGNIVTASPISDLNPLHIAAGAVLTIARLEVDSSGGVEVATRERALGKEFFVGYRKVDVASNEVAVSLHIPYPKNDDEYIYSFKQCRRREDDIAIVNAGMRIRFKSKGGGGEKVEYICREDGNQKIKGKRKEGSTTDAILYTYDTRQHIVEDIHICFGGMAPMPLSCSSFASYWIGKEWTKDNFITSLSILDKEIYLRPNTPGGMVAYRMRLARNFVFKFFQQICFDRAIDWKALMSKDMLCGVNEGGKEESDVKGLQLIAEDNNLKINSKDSTIYPALPPPSHITYNFSRSETSSVQFYGKQSGDLAARVAAGQPNKHMAGDLHVSGKAVYVDDMPCDNERELHAFLVTSTEAHAEIVSVDISDCSNVEGFVDYVSSQDIRGDNKIGCMFYDEEVFATKEVHSVGQVIGVSVGTSHFAAREAGARIKIKYKSFEDAVLSIDDAIIKRQFFNVNFTGGQALKLETFKNPKVYKSLDEFWELTDPKKFAESDNRRALSDRHQLPIISDPKVESQPQSYTSTCGEYVIVTGGVRMGGQEHFYLEPQGCRFDPSLENDEMTVISSTQDPSKTQHLISVVTGLPKHKIISKCKRMGGGFGGKETRAAFISSYAAVAAQKLRRPLRLILDRDFDFQISGQRHSFMMFYKVAMDRKTLKIFAADLQLYNDAGWSTDLSIPVMERAVFHSENSYCIPNIRIIGRCCRTNLPSNTAFRGFGGPQGMFLAETYIEHLAVASGEDADRIRLTNFYRIGDRTPYGYEIVEDHLTRIWGELVVRSRYHERKREIDIFNASSDYIKRGLKMVPVKFGMSFTKTFMNQAGSLVHVYTDGTILISHTGTEMGQGLHTKVAQVAATEFDVPINCIYISETSTDKVPNGMPTAASSGSDLNGYATLLACRKILEGLRPYIEEEKRLVVKDRAIENRDDQKNVKNGEKKIKDIDTYLTDSERQGLFKKAAFKAHMARVNLSANGFYATPGINFDFETNSGRPFHYLAYGMACSEVQVDVLTGDYIVRRVDIVEDVGASLNPAIDIGQVEGAFIQGLGLFTLEEIVTLPNGAMLTRGPSTYKIPSFGDIPRDFRVFLLEGVKNPSDPSVYSSKGVGEPPLFLASSVFFAIRECIEAKKRDMLDDGGLLEEFRDEGRKERKCVEDSDKIECGDLRSHGDRYYMKRSIGNTEIGENDSDLMKGCVKGRRRRREWVLLDSPATAERICNACYDI